MFTAAPHVDVGVLADSGHNLSVGLSAGEYHRRVLSFAEATYFLIGTDRGVHFASNRTISKSDPLNIVETSDVGLVPNCGFVKLENKVYYVGVDPKSDPPRGNQLLSLSYSEIGTSFDATPEHIFAQHLVDARLLQLVIVERRRGVVAVDLVVAAEQGDEAASDHAEERRWLAGRPRPEPAGAENQPAACTIPSTGAGRTSTTFKPALRNVDTASARPRCSGQTACEGGTQSHGPPPRRDSRRRGSRVATGKC